MDIFMVNIAALNAIVIATLLSQVSYQER